MNVSRLACIETMCTKVPSLTSDFRAVFPNSDYESLINSFIYDGSNVANLQFNLEKASPSVKIEIMNDAGTVVRTMDLGAGEAGDNQVNWDGMTSLGVLAKSGAYSYNVTAKDSQGADVKVIPQYAGVVDGISYKDGTSYLNVSGILVPYDKIQNVY